MSQRIHPLLGLSQAPVIGSNVVPLPFGHMLGIEKEHLRFVRGGWICERLHKLHVHRGLGPTLALAHHRLMHSIVLIDDMLRTRSKK